MAAWLHLHSARGRDSRRATHRHGTHANAMHCRVVSFMHRSCNATARLQQPSGYDGLALQANPGPGPTAFPVRVPPVFVQPPMSHPIPGIGRDPSCNRARMPSRRIAPSIYQGGGGRPGGSRSPPSDDAPLPRSLHPLRGSAS